MDKCPKKVRQIMIDKWLTVNDIAELLSLEKCTVTRRAKKKVGHTAVTLSVAERNTAIIWRTFLLISN
jgi:predicted transcriptional regulator